MLAPTTSAPPNIVSAPNFYAQIDCVSKPLPLSEIKNISSQVEPHPYLYNDAKTGMTYHTKQFGQTKPPEVQLVTPFDLDTFPQIWAWHELARHGKEQARTSSVQLFVLTPNGGKGSYLLDGAWLSKVDVSVPKAGATDTGQVNMTIVCDDIRIV
jgi:hypothetical protein